MPNCLDCGMKKTETTKSDVPSLTWCRVSLSVPTFLVSRPSWLLSITRWLPETDIFVTPTRNSTSLSSPQERLLRLHGMVRWSSFVVWLNPKSTLLTRFPWRRCSTKSPRHQFLKPATHQCFAAPQFAPIWAAFLCLISALTRAGSAFATVQCTISSAVLDKAPQQRICLTLTTRCTAQSSASKSRSSPMSPLSSSTCECANSLSQDRYLIPQQVKIAISSQLV